MVMERRVATGKYVNLLRRACRVLCSVPAHVIGSVSVTFTLGSPEEVAAVVELIERLAEEYELQAQTVVDGRGLTSHFRRRPEAGEK